MVQRSDMLAIHETDETAWLESTAERLRHRRFEEIDSEHLAEYLTDMARRDRREVYSRLRILLAHLLKWEHQPASRSQSWRSTIREQRSELRQLLESGTLRNHALAILPAVYAECRDQAAEETELPLEAFPGESPWDLDEILAGS